MTEEIEEGGEEIQDMEHAEIAEAEVVTTHIAEVLAEVEVFKSQQLTLEGAGIVGMQGTNVRNAESINEISEIEDQKISFPTPALKPQ